MFPNRRTPTSLKRLADVLNKIILGLRRQPGPAPAGSVIIGLAAGLLTLVGALMELAVEPEVSAA